MPSVHIRGPNRLFRQASCIHSMRSLFLVLLLATVCQSFDVVGPLSEDFQTWLNKHGYQDDDFVRQDYGTKGSYGGKTGSATSVSNTPVIFVHGNSDTALKTSSSSTGWDNSILYFLGKGYTSAELYATSWGDNKASNANTRTHNCKDVTRLRRFVQAVLVYTGAKQVSIVTHSMGVTLMRKAIKGGKITANDGSCNIGFSLKDSVQVFVGLAGANYGLCSCSGLGTMYVTCNKKNGLWCGDSCGLNMASFCGFSVLPYPCSSPTYSQFLMDMNSDHTAEGDNVFSAWSLSDNLILYADKVWGRPTSLIPTSTGQKVYDLYTHMQTKELTADDQFAMINQKKIPTL